MESIHQQIAEELKSGAQDIRTDGGVAYHYTPSLVDSIAFYPETLDPSLEVVWLFRPGEEEHTEDESGGGPSDIGMSATAEFFLVVAHRYEASSEEPGHQPEPSRATVVDRLVRDALRYLLADIRLGGLVENIVNGSLFVNRNWWDPAWAVAELRFVVLYSYRSGAP